MIAGALVVAVLVLAGLLYVWYGSSPPGGNVKRPNPPVRLEPVQAGLAWPIALGFASDGRIFFAERNTGNIRIIQSGVLLPTPFYALPSTATAGERGLLGLALDPAFPSAPYVYAYQTYNDGANGTVYNRIVRIVANGNVGISHSVILQMLPLTAAMNHNGGVIAFGPDRKLWAVVGENADSSLAQDPRSLLGKVLRMNADGSAPSDNPFYGNSAWEDRVYTYGHRNMFGLDWHPLTKSAYVTENGPACNDEVNRLSAGRNFGWGPSETCGTPPLPPANTNRDGPTPVMPLAYWTPTIAPTNAAFFTGSLLPQSQNDLIFGAYNDRRLRDLKLSSDGTSLVNETTLLTAPSGILDVEMGLDGSLWVTTSSTIYRLVDATVPGAASPLAIVARVEILEVFTATKPALQAFAALE
jgi:glucose/arabinose dehydrogenase